MVSNGYLTPKALKELRNAGLDAINIDIKGTDRTYEQYSAPPNGKSKYVWISARKAVKLGIHLEMINLIVTGVNDDEESIMNVIENHLKYVGPQVPLHFTRYFPAYEFYNPPTKVSTLEKAVEMARKEGIEYVYIGNVITYDTHSSTICSKS
jgi:pyruvate formate lyase activating enzyme